MSTKLDDLLPDALVYMALMMDVPDILSLCNTNSKFNRYICENGDFWLQRLGKDYNIGINDIPDGTSYRQYYKNIYNAYERAGGNINQRIMVAAAYNLKRDFMDLIKSGNVTGPIKYMALKHAITHSFNEAVKYMVDNEMVDLGRVKDLLYLPTDDIEMFKYLVDNGAFINTYNTEYDLNNEDYGYPFEYAVRKGQTKIANYLNNLGAKPQKLRMRFQSIQ